MPQFCYEVDWLIEVYSNVVVIRGYPHIIQTQTELFFSSYALRPVAWSNSKILPKLRIRLDIWWESLDGVLPDARPVPT
jgi:hypothetical protein